ncbi:hypothetical protein HanOQP8_Chr11g0422231 [Helianthus annuus]|nr:hypothetical protein HanOQP8_Chr11g0422231 [Helianthus annuus]
MEATNGSNETVVQATARDMKIMGDGEDTAEENSTMKVWIAVDESDGSFYALEWALKHLFAHHDANKESPFAITVVHVQPPFQPTYTALPVGPGKWSCLEMFMIRFETLKLSKPVNCLVS